MYVNLQLLTVHCAEPVKLRLEEENSHDLWNINKPAQHNTLSSPKNGNEIGYIPLWKTNEFSEVI
jgi:hypothetical protein